MQRSSTASSAVQISGNRSLRSQKVLGAVLQQDPLGFAAGDVNLHRYAGNDPTNATDPTGLAAVAPGEFDQGTVSFSKFEKLEGTQDIFLTGKEISRPLSLREMQGARGLPNDFSKAVTLGQAAVQGLTALGYTSTQRVFRYGLDAKINANFKKGADPNRYFWSQLVEERSSSNNAAFTEKFLHNASLEWDGGYAYPASVWGKTSLAMTDTPSYNVACPEKPAPVAGGWAFVPPQKVKDHDDFRDQFTKFNASYEMLFITQLRRFKPGYTIGHLIVAAGFSVGPLAPTTLQGLTSSLGGAIAYNERLQQITEAVGQYTWGFKILAKPFSVQPIAPKWEKFK
jgi:hypothetical protein